MRRIAELAALIAGILIGYALAAAVASPAGFDPSVTPIPGPRLSRPTSTTAAAPTTTVATGTTEPTAITYLVWATGGLPAGLGEALKASFPSVSLVEGDPVELTLDDGTLVPLDAIALDPEAHRPFDPDLSLEALRSGGVILGESSARLRQVGVGEILDIGGVGFEVVAVAPDGVIAAAELVFADNDGSAPVETDRFALISTDLDRDRFEAEVRLLYDGPAPLRIRAEGESPWLRHGDAVLPQVFIKEALGEFSYTGRHGVRFVQEPDFVEQNIVRVEVPILGEVRCHRRVAEMLSAAMRQLQDEGLSHLVEPGGFAGCWNPRYIRAATGTSAGVSRHAWGAAVDLNAPSNPLGSAGTQDPRLVEVMEEWGFTWGGRWLVPDPMHFEYGIDPG